MQAFEVGSGGARNVLSPGTRGWLIPWLDWLRSRAAKCVKFLYWVLGDMWGWETRRAKST